MVEHREHFFNKMILTLHHIIASAIQTLINPSCSG